MALKTCLCAGSLLVCLAVLSCETAEDAFIGHRLLNICDEAYWICNRPSQCVLESDDFTEGGFPGIRRVVIPVEEQSETLEIRLYFQTMESPGTELNMTLYDPDCHVDKNNGVVQLLDSDIFDDAGDDRTLIFHLESSFPGEHLLEIYSDASAKYLLIVEPK